VASLRKIEANRSNARKGRGPRSAAGKSLASRNALRHGLAAATHKSAVNEGDIENFARALCGGDDDPALYAQAIIVAKSDFTLRTVVAPAGRRYRTAA
jgi:hypothetical protein